MNKLIKTLTCVILLTVLCSCASIVSHSSWPLKINSKPVGATVEITDKNGDLVFVGKTPAKTYLKSGAGYFSSMSYNVKISKDGYTDKVIYVGCDLNGWYIGNIFLGGLIGWLIVDPLTGAMYRLNTDNVYATLTKSFSYYNSQFWLPDINNLPLSIRSNLVAVK